MCEGPPPSPESIFFSVSSYAQLQIRFYFILKHEIYSVKAVMVAHHIHLYVWLHLCSLMAPVCVGRGREHRRWYLHIGKALDHLHLGKALGHLHLGKALGHLHLGKALGHLHLGKALDLGKALGHLHLGEALGHLGRDLRSGQGLRSPPLGQSLRSGQGLRSPPLGQGLRSPPLG